MTSQKSTPQSKAAEKYRNALAGLAGIKGQRNSVLLGLCNHGVMAALSDEHLISEIISASGTPPLTTAEVRHAIQTARRDTQPLGDGSCTGRTWRPTPPKPAPLGSGAVTFVKRMIECGSGATIEALRKSSLRAIPDSPMLQTKAFLETLYQPEEWLFCGSRYSRGVPKADLDTCSEWARLIGNGKLTAPELLCCNPLSGVEGMNKNGKPSYRCAACVTEQRYTLVEFDAMSLNSQAEFWTGVIKSHVLPVKSLVYSGSKSIHGLIEIRAETIEEWNVAIEELHFATCNRNAPKEYQADRACRNPDRLTRLAGAWRPETKKNQSLLWLS
jgi:hypothetical protein